MSGGIDFSTQDISEAAELKSNGKSQCEDRELW